MKFQTPVVSIIIATYNRAQFIGATLNSLLEQTYSNFEVIIVDDWGNDNTEEVLKPYLGDSRFFFYKRNEEFPKGCPGSRNYGMTKAKGKYIWFFDDDDIAHPQLLELCIKELDTSKIDFIRFGRAVFYNIADINFSQNRNVILEEVTKDQLKLMIMGRLPFNSCQVIWRKASLKDQRFRGDIIYADDWEFYSRLLSNGLKGLSATIILLYARKHPGSSTHKYKSKDKKILESVTSATFQVIDISIREQIMDREMFQFFYRQALNFKQSKIVMYLLKKTEANLFDRTKYGLGYHFYPVIKPLFRFRGRYFKSQSSE